MTLLDVRDLRLYYSSPRGVVHAVDGVSLTLEDGEALGVVGESGCGKTSLALALMRLPPRNVQAHSGVVIFEGVDLMSLLDEEFRRRIRWKKISIVFQGAMNSLNPVMRVGWQVAEPLQSDGAVTKEEVRRQVLKLLRMVGLPEDVFWRYPHELSGGMKQRVVIATSLILEPRLIILDEPTSALDVSVQAQIVNMLKKLKRELGLSMLFITHDIALASDICDRFVVLYGGQTVEVGSAEQVLLEPKHPYAQKLLASTPRLSVDRPTDFISGAPPDLVNPPQGCRFHPRCPFVFAPCKTPPPMVGLAEGQAARCWLYRDRE